MPSLKSILRHVVRPREAAMTVNARLTNLRSDTDYNPEGIRVMDEDWDVLIILDECRYDVFEQRHSLPGELSHRISRGGGTIEFLRGNFRDEEFYDTVYVTANPQIVRLKDELNVAFHDVVDVWKEHWDEEIQNVSPGTMTAIARETIERYPDKRIILHYNQPHGPFLGPTAEDLVIGPTRNQNESLLDFLYYEFRHDTIPLSTWRAAYIENFDIVHEHVARLLEDIEGKIVVTADHGALLGERGWPIPVRQFGHQIGNHQAPLVTVPWLEYESGSRREVTAERPTRKRGSEEDVAEVDRRLRDLGYLGTD